MRKLLIVAAWLAVLTAGQTCTTTMPTKSRPAKSFAHFSEHGCQAKFDTYHIEIVTPIWPSDPDFMVAMVTWRSNPSLTLEGQGTSGARAGSENAPGSLFLWLFVWRTQHRGQGQGRRRRRESGTPAAGTTRRGVRNRE